MQPTFRPVDPDGQRDAVHLCRWGNDPAIRHLFQRFPTAASAAKVLEPAQVGVLVRRSLARGKHMFMIDVGGRTVGEVTLHIDAAEIHRKIVGTAWFGLIIGDEGHRRCGLGTLAMEFAEARARELGAHRGELGVFEFNGPARALYARLGYREVARIPEYTWWNDALWADIRMEKPL